MDHPAPDESTLAVWWSLSSPERRPLTRNLMREAIAELNAMIDVDKIRYKAERARIARSKSAQLSMFTTLTPLAERIDQAETLRKTLMRTSANLERIHSELNFRHKKEQG